MAKQFWKTESLIQGVKIKMRKPKVCLELLYNYKKE